MPEGTEEKKKRKLRERLEGKKQMIALWAAIIGLFGTNGIPKIIELLSSRPSIEKVQDMIAKQTLELSNQQRTAVETLQKMDAEVVRLRDGNDRLLVQVSKLEGSVDFIEDVLRDCCTRRLAVRKLLEKPAVAPSPPVTKALSNGLMKLWIEGEKHKARPVRKLKKVPEFNVQQQLQMQEPSKE